MSGIHPRERAALALIGALLIAASSAQAAIHFERPDQDSDRHEIVAAGSPDAAAPDAQQIVARAHAHEQQTGIARRGPESPHSIELRLPVCRPETPRRALPRQQDAERLASGSGCAEVARWCLAHATSTDDP